MKALSVKQPFANMIASGEKVIEYRTWRTLHRGDLLICSSARPKSPEPIGVALVIVELIDCLQVVGAPPQIANIGTADISRVWIDQELVYSAKKQMWAWLLRNPRPIEYPFPVKGRLGLYNVAIELSAIKGQK